MVWFDLHTIPYRTIPITGCDTDASVAEWYASLADSLSVSWFTTLPFSVKSPKTSSSSRSLFWAIWEVAIVDACNSRSLAQ